MVAVKTTLNHFLKTKDTQKILKTYIQYYLHVMWKTCTCVVIKLSRSQLILIRWTICIWYLPRKIVLINYCHCLDAECWCPFIFLIFTWPTFLTIISHPWQMWRTENSRIIFNLHSCIWFVFYFFLHLISFISSLLQDVFLGFLVTNNIDKIIFLPFS